MLANVATSVLCYAAIASAQHRWTGQAGVSTKTPSIEPATVTTAAPAVSIISAPKTTHAPLPAVETTPVSPNAPADAPIPTLPAAPDNMFPDYRPYYGGGYHYPDPVTNTLRTEIFSTSDLNPLAQYESRDVTEISTIVIHPAVPTSWAASDLPPISYPSKPAGLNDDEHPETQRMLAKRQYFTPTTYTNYHSVDYTKTEVVGPISVSTQVDIVNAHHETTIVPPGVKIADPPSSTSKQAVPRLPIRKGVLEPQELRKRWYGFESTLTNWISHATYSTVIVGSPVMIEERTNTEYWDQAVSPPSLFATPPPSLTATLSQPTPTKPHRVKRYYGDSTVTNSVYEVTRISKVLDKDISTATYIVNDSVVTTIVSPVHSSSSYYPYHP